MLIYFENGALIEEGKENYLRPGLFKVLQKLHDSGFGLATKFDELNEVVKKWFSNEGIEFIDHSQDADYQISYTDGEYIVLKEDREELKTRDTSDLIRFFKQGKRVSSLKRQTSETNIEISVDLDGTGKSDIATGLHFFDHMLDQIARHGHIDLMIQCKGDLEVDEHHTIEDTAIALGEVINEALGNKTGINRYGFYVPMDEAQASVVLDLSGRPFLNFQGDFEREYVGDFPTEMTEHFFYSLAMNLKATIHVRVAGKNNHHKIEACFKALARALKTAIEKDPRIKNLIPSSKGSL